MSKIYLIDNYRDNNIKYRGVYYADLGIEIFSEKYNQAWSKYEYPCVVCGRKTNHSEGVLIGGGGETIVHPEDEDKAQDGGYMGFFAVGTECIKKVPQELRVAWKVDY